VNALSHAVRLGLGEGLRAAAGDPAVAAIAIVCAGRTVIAGADITEFGKPPREPGLADVLDLIEGNPKPVVAGIHGTALGGGLEVALACHYRVGVKAARFGLPEVKLGLLPGAGGTQRLPRVVGVETALQMIVSGDPIGADEALRHGLIDQIVEGDLAAATVAFAERVVAEGRPLRKIRDLDDKLVEARRRPELFAEFRKSVARTTRGFRAPERCIQAVEAAVSLPFAQGLGRERELFLELMGSPESQAQRYFFFAEREAAKIPDVPATTPVAEIRKAAVIGAGTMGGGIAMNFANAGIPVTVVEVGREALDRGLAVVRKNYEATAARGRLSPDELARRLALIRGSVDFGDVADADMVIEAVFEEMPVKKEVFTRLDGLAKPGAVLATNTSTLNVDEIAGATKRPESVIGMHFFSPANVMRLLEVVRGARTAKPTIATAMAVGRRIAKVPVLVGVCDGFVGNRMLHQRGREAERLILEGALPHQVDKVLFDFGFPMGPFAMGDLAGLDVGWRIRKGKGMKSAVADRLCEMGRFGQKTGAGYYRYEAGDRTARPDPEVERIILDVSRGMGIERRPIPDEEILARLLYPMVNEGAKILDEKLAIRASDIDVIWVYGYGWPVYRGGPMHWADSVGLDVIRKRMLDLKPRLGAHWQPADLLVRLADSGEGFTRTKGAGA
jgi:3-hydroxyacyl-CoA dehydrogenase